jgi:hypothetical protein
MARKTTTTTNANSPTAYTQADAWLRLELVDAKGGRHRLPKDVALYLKNHVSANMINKADPDNGGDTFEFKFVGTVHLVDNTPKADIEL